MTSLGLRQTRSKSCFRLERSKIDLSKRTLICGGYKGVGDELWPPLRVIHSTAPVIMSTDCHILSNLSRTDNLVLIQIRWNMGFRKHICSSMFYLEALHTYPSLGNGFLYGTRGKLRVRGEQTTQILTESYFWRQFDSVVVDIVGTRSLNLM